MRSAPGRFLRLRYFSGPFFTLLLVFAVLNTAVAQQPDPNNFPSRPRIVPLPALSAELLRPSFPLAPVLQPASILESAINDKLGIRYRFFGTDDRGYDCSGFVWRVFREIGANFDRMPARELWRFFPEATPEESRQFGTLVFFNGLGHVGIVRDAYSFYHASRSQGIVLSFFAGYWEKRLTGFRRAPIPLMPGMPMMMPPPDLVAAQRQ